MSLAYLDAQGDRELLVNTCIQKDRFLWFQHTRLTHVANVGQGDTARFRARVGGFEHHDWLKVVGRAQRSFSADV